MKRGIICILILSLMLTFSVVELFYLKNEVEKICNGADNIISLSQSGDTSGTKNAIIQLRESWNILYKRCAFFIQTQKLEETNLSISRLESLLANENDEFYSELASIKAGLKKIYQNELPRIENVI